jgi:hypothetical protein
MLKMVPSMRALRFYTGFEREAAVAIGASYKARIADCKIDLGMTGGAAIAGNLVCIDLDGFWRFHVFLRHWVVAVVQGDPLLIDPTDWRMIPKAAQQSTSFRA